MKWDGARMATLMALLLAGPCLFAEVREAAEPIEALEPNPTLEPVAPLRPTATPATAPARQVAKGPSPEEGRQEQVRLLREDMSALKDGLARQKAELAAANARLKSLEEALSGAAAARRAVAEQAVATDALATRVARQETTLRDELAGVKQAQAEQKADLGGLRGDVERQAQDLGVLADSLQASLKRTSESLKRMEDFQADFKEKRDRLEGLSDLMGAVRKDVNDNTQEIVELRRQVKALGGGEDQAKAKDESFLDQMVNWRYMGPTALAVAIVAVFLAIR